VLFSGYSLVIKHGNGSPPFIADVSIQVPIKFSDFPAMFDCRRVYRTWGPPSYPPNMAVNYQQTDINKYNIYLLKISI
jgi:hypothetical protein